jgi:SAM-dependent methyltransferase
VPGAHGRRRQLSSRALYAEVRGQGLAPHVQPQWGSLATLGQYDVPFAVSRRWLPRPGPVLDWGAGNGHFSYFLLREGFEVTGYAFEPAPAFLRARGGYAHRQADPGEGVALPFPDGAFAGVVGVGVLEHVHEMGGAPEASVREIHRVLRPGGRFLCFHLPNRLSWIEWAKRRRGKARLIHTRLYDRADFARLLAPTSFVVVAAGRYNVLPRNSLNRLPAALADAPAFGWGLGLVDRGLGRALAPLCQNWFFVVEKGARPGG